MFTRLVSTLVLLAFINFLVGCSTNVRLAKEELPQKKVEEKITEVILTTGEVVKFDSRGGSYITSKIVGVKADGKPAEISFESITEIRTSRPQVISKEDVTDQKIVEVVLLNWTIGIFDDQGGKSELAAMPDEEGRTSDITERVIAGRTKDGTEVKVSFDKIRELRISKPDTISTEDLLADGDQHIAEVVVRDLYLVSFDEDGGRLEGKGPAVAGFTELGRSVQIGLDDILYVRVSRSDPVVSILAVVGVIALALAFMFAIAMATKESCPFVYSFDGEKYTFDAEPLGGAICAGLKKSDYSRLEHLRPVDGKYSLLLRNEVEETQYVDQLKLLVVDHVSDSEVMPDTAGNMYSVKTPVTPTLAFNENGEDLKKFVERRDDVAWQTHLPKDDSYLGGDLRHQLTFEFPKPPDAKTAKLLVNAGTALWGSNMIREMLQLRGDKVDAWYEAVNRGEAELMDLIGFIEREELYLLKIHLKEGESWVHHGYISGGGPLITEDRVIHLDVSNVTGDRLVLRLNPPMGFWSIDYIGIEYGNYPDPEITEVSLASGHDQYETDISELLRSSDESYLVLPEVGDWAKVDFDVPPQEEGTTRSMFLMSSGYYEIHISKDQPEQTEFIRQLLTTPGMIVEFAMNEYLKWRSIQLSSR
jgi:hypothetical protein